MTKSTTVTKAAMMTMNAGMRILSGIRLATRDITRLDMTNTKVVAAPMPIPLAAEVVVARVGHMPNTSPKVGFSRKMPLVNVFIGLMF